MGKMLTGKKCPFNTAKNSYTIQILCKMLPKAMIKGYRQKKLKAAAVARVTLNLGRLHRIFLIKTTYFRSAAV